MYARWRESGAKKNAATSSLVSHFEFALAISTSLIPIGGILCRQRSRIREMRRIGRPHEAVLSHRQTHNRPRVTGIGVGHDNVRFGVVVGDVSEMLAVGRPRG